MRENQKKERKLYVHQLLLIILLLIVAIVVAIIGQGAWSRYITVEHGSSNAEVADWNVVFSRGSNIFTKTYSEVVDERMAPGTEGSVEYGITSHAEVAYHYTLNLTNLDLATLPYNLVLTVNNGNNTATPVVAKRAYANSGGTTAGKIGGDDGITVSKTEAGNYSNTFTLNWSWAYQTTGVTILSEISNLNAAERTRVAHDLVELAFEKGVTGSTIDALDPNEADYNAVATINAAVNTLKTATGLTEAIVAQAVNDAVDTADTERLNTSGTNDLHFDVILKAIQVDPATGNVVDIGNNSGSGNGGSSGEQGGPTIVGEINRWEPVNYNPGTLTTASLDLPEGAKVKGVDIASLNLPSGASIDSTIDASEASDWVVLDVTEDGDVLIIPTTYDTDELTLSGMNGYNNAIEALDAVAGIYVNPTYAKSARSINVEDLNKVENFEYATGSVGENGIIYSWNNRYGMNQSTFDIIDYGEGNEAERTYKMTEETHPYDYNLSAASSYITSDCWLASRSVRLGDNICVFNVRFVSYGGVEYGSDLFHVSDDGGAEEYVYGCSVLPVVSLKSGIHMEKVNGTWQLSE